jgi:ATP-dependent RNA helicase DDX56/DBP9
MKRKLDENDVPGVVPIAPAGKNGVDSFDRMGFDPRLLQALAREEYTKPTLVQAKGIPLALEGKDIFGMSPSSVLAQCRI